MSSKITYICVLVILIVMTTGCSRHEGNSTLVDVSNIPNSHHIDELDSIYNTFDYCVDGYKPIDIHNDKELHTNEDVHDNDGVGVSESELEIPKEENYEISLLETALQIVLNNLPELNRWDTWQPDTEFFGAPQFRSSFPMYRKV